MTECYRCYVSRFDVWCLPHSVKHVSDLINISLKSSLFNTAAAAAAADDDDSD